MATKIVYINPGDMIDVRICPDSSPATAAEWRSHILPPRVTIRVAQSEIEVFDPAYSVFQGTGPERRQLLPAQTRERTPMCPISEEPCNEDMNDDCVRSCAAHIRATEGRVQTVALTCPIDDEPCESNCDEFQRETCLQIVRNPQSEHERMITSSPREYELVEYSAGCLDIPQLDSHQRIAFLRVRDYMSGNTERLRAHDLRVVLKLIDSKRIYLRPRDD